MKNDDLSLAKYWTPRYWPIWCLWLTLRVTSCLPFRWQIALGKRFGRLLKVTLRKNSHAVRCNLAICFPELSDTERNDLHDRHFEALGASLAEMGLAWFAPLERIQELVRIEGREHFIAAEQKGKGILLCAAHFTTLEIGIAIMEDLCEAGGGMYRPANNPMIDTIVRRGRKRTVQNLRPSDDVRGIVRDLRENAMVVYLPDHAYAGNSSELIPFFGEPAVTTTATSKLAKLTGATVLSYFFRRLPDDSGYVVDIQPPLADFPTDDAIADTKRMVNRLEEYIRLAPEQYIWTYRRFKGRPESYSDVYRRDS